MPINKALDKNGKPIKKDGLQKYRVRINYTDNYGKPKQIERTAYGADEAKQLERELTYKIKEEKPARKITVQELYNQYCDAKISEVRETSFKKSQQILNIHVLSTLGGVKIDKLTIPTLQKWKQGISEKGLAIRTKQNVYKEFRAMLNFAVKMEYIPNNPLLKVGNFKAPLEMKEEMDFYVPAEFGKFIDEARKYAEALSTDLSNWNYYVFFCIAFYTGMRKGEIYALTWNDISENEIKVTKSLCQKLKGGDRITPPKNKSSVRTIQIPIPLKEVLTEHRERCKTMDGFSENLFVCGGIRPIRDTSVENMNIKFAAAAGIKKIRIHDFRHSHAILLANNGINIQEIAKRLGHSDANITLKTYSHLYPAESDRALSVLNQLNLK